LPPGSNPPDDLSSSDSGVLLPDNRCTASGRSRRSQTADTTRTSPSSTLGSSGLKLPKLATNDGRGIYKTAAIFAAWVRDLRDYLELAEMDLESNYTMIWVGMYLNDSTKMLYMQFRANAHTKYLGVEEFLQALRQYCIPFTSKETLWNEFQAICQTINGRTLPIQDIANKIKQYQMQLSRISNWQCYHQLLEAMDAPLLQAVRPFINTDIDWEKLIEQYEIHDSVRKINKHSTHSSSKPHQRPHLQSKPYTPMVPSNSSFKPNHRFDRNRKPTSSTSCFTKLTQ